jgi:hypothetical protein
VDEIDAAEQKRNEARNDVQRFGLAHQDMRIALATVRHLRSLPVLKGQAAADVRFAFETAIVVIYVRPYKSRASRRIHRDKFAPERASDASWHEQFIGLRDTLYAHTDEYDASGRRIRAPHESVPAGEFTEEWQGWQPSDDPDVEAMLKRQWERLVTVAEFAQARLRRADAKLNALKGSAGSAG